MRSSSDADHWVTAGRQIQPVKRTAATIIGGKFGSFGK